MEKKHLEHFGAIGDALHHLWDAAETQYIMAQKQQQAAQTAINEVTAATKALNNAAKSLTGQLVNELNQAMDGAAKGAAHLLTVKFTDANEQAELAAATYKSAASWTTFKIFAFAAGVGALVVCAGVLVLLRSLPSHDDVKAMQGKIDQMSKTIATLEKRGGRAVIVPCRTPDNVARTCVQVDDYKTGQRYPMVISGY